MNTCENCKHWHRCDQPEANHSHYCYEEYNESEDVYATGDMSCPRFEAKEPVAMSGAEKIGVLREALEWNFRSLCAYLDYAPTDLVEQCYDPEGAIASARAALEQTK